MFTEEEAATKWCPHVRLPVIVPAPDHSCPAATGNHMTAMDDECVCIGSACMAWRWGEIAFRMYTLCDDRKAKTEPPRPDHAPATYEWRPYDEAEDMAAGWVEPDAERDARRKGYCGLSGKPT